MKKLISAAASLAMAASMVSSAVPFVTGAADASKSFELRTYLGKDGKEVSTTISADAIKAGAVTIPVGVYLVEGTNDCDSMTAQWTVNSTDGDASAVTFTRFQAGGSKYFSSAQSVTLANGGSGSVDTVIGFAGTITNDPEDGDYFTLTGKGQFFAEPNSKSAGTDNAFGSFAWTAPGNGSGYKWAGAKSDDYPIYVVDVTFPQNTPAGTYTIDFCDYVPEPDFPDNRSCMIEAPDGKLTSANGKLNLKGLEIKIGDGGQQPAVTTAPATTTSQTFTTTTKGGDGPSVPGDSEVDEKFIVKPEDKVVVPGEPTVIGIYATNGSNRLAGAFVAEVIDANLPIAGATATMTSTRCTAVSGSPSYEEINGTWYCDTLDAGEPQEIDTSKPVARYTITVPAGTPAGEYEWKLDRFHVVEDGYNGVEFDANLQTGKIIIEGGDDPVATTTTAPVATTTTTTAPPVATTTTTAITPGNVLYGDTNCDGKVNIADVVVLNKWLNDAKSYDLSAQGKVNADCCDAKGGDGLDANDSDAIIKSIVHLVKALPCTAADLK